MHGHVLGMLTLVSVLGLPPDREDLARARQLYNAEQYDAAIAAADELRAVPALADAASLLVARAHLERFRRSAEAADLTAARDALRQVRAESLGPRDRVELIIGLGESLYLDDAFGPAAELFEGALGQRDQMTRRMRERLLDWWASALDRQAQLRPPADRAALYRRVVDRMEEELKHDPVSAPASYWLAAGSRGLGDLDRAWEAAIAGWVRAPFTSDRGAAVRADLDRLVQQAIVPERARQLSASNRDAVDQTAETLRTEWDAFKQKWMGREEQ